MSRIDWRTFRAEFAQGAKAAGFRCEGIHDTASGPIEAWLRGEEGPLIYLSSGMHGDEPAGPLALLEWIRSGVPEGRIRWALVPMLNPTGLEASTRENAEGCDMNRDYLSKRSAEVAAHVAWLETIEVPDLFISLHEDWEAAGFYLYEIRIGMDQPSQTRKVLQAAAEFLPLEPGPRIDGHEVREAGWIFHGTDPDEPSGWPEAIYLSRIGCPLSYTMETGSQAPLGTRVRCHVSALNQLITNMLPK